MAIRPEKALTMTPVKIGSTNDISAPCSKAAGASSITEPSIEGIEMRKANFTPNSLLSPEKRLPTHLLKPCIFYPLINT